MYLLATSIICTLLEIIQDCNGLDSKNFPDQSYILKRQYENNQRASNSEDDTSGIKSRPETKLSDKIYTTRESDISDIVDAPDPNESSYWNSSKLFPLAKPEQTVETYRRSKLDLSVEPYRSILNHRKNTPNQDGIPHQIDPANKRNKLEMSVQPYSSLTYFKKNNGHNVDSQRVSIRGHRHEPKQRDEYYRKSEPDLRLKSYRRDPSNKEFSQKYALHERDETYYRHEPKHKFEFNQKYEPYHSEDTLKQKDQRHRSDSSSKVSDAKPRIKNELKNKRRYWLVNQPVGKPITRQSGYEDEKDENLKKKITTLVEQTIHDTEKKVDSVQHIKEKYRDQAPYKAGFILSMVKKSRDIMNELFNVAVRHKDQWKGLEQLKVFELIVHTNVDSSNLVRQLVEVHIQHLNATNSQSDRRKLILL